MVPNDPASLLIHEWSRFHRDHSAEEVEALSKQLRSLVWRHRVKSYLRKLFPFVLLIAICYALSQCPSVVATVMTYVRIFLVHVVFSVIDLPRLGSARCLVPNPYYDKSMISVDPEECIRCVNIRRPVSVDATNFTASDFVRDFAEQDTPLIVRDGAKGWPVTSMSVQNLHDLYVHDPDLRYTLPCSLHSTMDLPYANNKLLLKLLLERKPGRWFALWEHCTLNQTKAFRRYYKRPPFIPDSLSLGGHEMHSWIIIGQNPEDNQDPVPILFEGGYFFLGQARGRTEIRLEPREPCLEDKKCATLHLELSQGDLLMVTDMWYISAIPTGIAFSLTFGFAAES